MGSLNILKIFLLISCMKFTKLLLTFFNVYYYYYILFEESKNLQKISVIEPKHCVIENISRRVAIIYFHEFIKMPYQLVIHKWLCCYNLSPNRMLVSLTQFLHNITNFQAYAMAQFLSHIVKNFPRSKTEFKIPSFWVKLIRVKSCIFGEIHYSVWPRENISPQKWMSFFTNNQ